MSLGPERGLGAVAHIKLLKDGREVVLDGLLADLQAHRDHLIRLCQLQDLEKGMKVVEFHLARGEIGESGVASQDER